MIARVETVDVLILDNSEDTDMAKMCPWDSKHHELPQCKYVIRCFYKYPSIVLLSQEAKKDITSICSKIQFHVYHNVFRCNVHGRRPKQ